MSTATTRILLVDDDDDLLRLLAIRLEGAGYGVLTTNKAEQALAMISRERPHLVITDLRMPGMDGAALFEAIRAMHSSLPVIILTAHGTIPDAVAATNRGVFGYLTKPYDAQELLTQVEQALRLSVIGDSSKRHSASWRARIVTQSPLMESLLAQAQLVAASDASVLVQKGRSHVRAHSKTPVTRAHAGASAAANQNSCAASSGRRSGSVLACERCWVRPLLR